MRILIGGANRTLAGGAEVYQQALVEGLTERGHALAVLCEHGAQPGHPTIDAGVPATPAWCTAEAGTAEAVRRATQWAPDVVYVQGLQSPSLEAQLLNRWPGVLFAHDYYGVCESGFKRHAFPRVQMCARPFGPACLAFHFPRRCGGLSPVTMLRMYRLQAARNRLLSRYRAICVASDHMRSEYLRNHVPQDRLHVLRLPPTGINRLASPPPPRSPAGHLVMVSRLTPLKGADVLIGALPHATRLLGRSLALTIIGDGPERLRLAARARSHGVAVRFTGWLAAPERNRILGTADLLAMPSLWPEPWGLAGVEAAGLGTPAVAFAVGGIPEWLIPGQSGELAPADPPTAQGLADAIMRALRDPEHYARLKRGAWERVKHLTMERHLDELLPVLAAAAGQP